MASIQDRIEVAEQMHKVELDIMRRKAADYSGNDDCNRNIKACEALGICTAEQGLLIRMVDKISRLANVTKQGATMQVNEAVEDTLHDIRNYATIFADVYREKQNIPVVRLLGGSTFVAAQPGAHSAGGCCVPEIKEEF